MQSTLAHAAGCIGTTLQQPSSISIQLADMGLARPAAEPPEAKSPNVVTLWYRAPELLFGFPKYSAAVRRTNKKDGGCQAYVTDQWTGHPPRSLTSVASHIV